MTSDSDTGADDAATLPRQRAFRRHLVSFVLVNAVLVVVWAIATPGGFFWPTFPILGWGLGLAVQAWDVYSSDPTIHNG